MSKRWLAPRGFETDNALIETGMIVFVEEAAALRGELKRLMGWFLQIRGLNP